MRLSLPFSYLLIAAASNDGKAHSVRVYSDVTAEWTSSDRGTQVQWHSSKQDGKIITHQVQVASQSPFEEKDERTLRQFFGPCLAFLPVF